MKLRALDTRPPQHVRVTLDGATHDKLTAYLAYAAEQGQVFTDVRHLLTEIARAFVDGGDKSFTAWYRARQSATAVPARVPNGGENERPTRLSQSPSSVRAAVQEVAEESREGERKAR
jgi:hypothetical protein